MKLSKSPDIKISLHRRSQKCVFKKMKLSKVLISKFLYTQGLKNVCSKKMKLSKSPDIKISLHRRSQKCVFKKMKLSKSPDIKISQHRRSQKCVFKKMKKSLISKFLKKS